MKVTEVLKNGFTYIVLNKAEAICYKVGTEKEIEEARNNEEAIPFKGIYIIITKPIIAYSKI